MSRYDELEPLVINAAKEALRLLIEHKSAPISDLLDITLSDSFAHEEEGEDGTTRIESIHIEFDDELQEVVFKCKIFDEMNNLVVDRVVILKQ